MVSGLQIYIGVKSTRKYNIFNTIKISKMSFTLPELPYHKDSFGKLISV